MKVTNLGKTKADDVSISISIFPEPDEDLATQSDVVLKGPILNVSGTFAPGLVRTVPFEAIFGGVPSVKLEPLPRPSFLAVFGRNIYSTEGHIRFREDWCLYKASDRESRAILRGELTPCPSDIEDSMGQWARERLPR
jgi:hypothetical protein